MNYSHNYASLADGGLIMNYFTAAGPEADNFVNHIEALGLQLESLSLPVTTLVNVTPHHSAINMYDIQDKVREHMYS